MMKPCWWIPRHTNSSSNISREDVKVVIIKFVAVKVFVNKAPHALIAFTRIGCVVSIFHVGRWISGIWKLNSVKNRYTESLLLARAGMSWLKWQPPTILVQLLGCRIYWGRGGGGRSTEIHRRINTERLPECFTEWGRRQVRQTTDKTLIMVNRLGVNVRSPSAICRTSLIKVGPRWDIWFWLYPWQTRWEFEGIFHVRVESVWENAVIVGVKRHCLETCVETVRTGIKRIQLRGWARGAGRRTVRYVGKASKSECSFGITLRILMVGRKVVWYVINIIGDHWRWTRGIKAQRTFRGSCLAWTCWWWGPSLC